MRTCSEGFCRRVLGGWRFSKQLSCQLVSRRLFLEFASPKNSVLFPSKSSHTTAFVGATLWLRGEGRLRGVNFVEALIDLSPFLLAPQPAQNSPLGHFGMPSTRSNAGSTILMRPSPRCAYTSFETIQAHGSSMSVAPFEDHSLPWR